LNNEMFHAAIKILDNRAEQYGIYDDELMHYGRKGMKKGEHIFGEDEFTEEDRARGQAVREAQRQERAKQEENQSNLNKMKAKVLAEKARREGHGPDDAATVMKKMQNGDEKILNTPLGNAMTPDMGNAMRPMYEGKTDSVQITDSSSSSSDRIHNLSSSDARYNRKAYDESITSATEDFINNNSKKQTMLDKARESGHGPNEEHVSNKPNIATTDDVKAKKKQDLLDKEVTNQTGAKPMGPKQIKAAVTIPAPKTKENPYKDLPEEDQKEIQRAYADHMIKKTNDDIRRQSEEERQRNKANQPKIDYSGEPTELQKTSNTVSAIANPRGYLLSQALNSGKKKKMHQSVSRASSHSKSSDMEHSFNIEIDKHLYLIHGVTMDAINVNRDAFVKYVRSLDGKIDDDTVNEIKHSAHTEFNSMIINYAKTNKIPLDNPDVQCKFNTAYQSICGRYDDVIDEACKKGRYR